MKETQMLKGVLEGCVLAIISQREIYGYELVQALKQHGFENIVGGTVYPLLQKLEKQGDIIGELKSSPEGPDRKYFTLSTAGRENLASFEEQWQKLVAKVATIIAEGGEKDE